MDKRLLGPTALHGGVGALLPPDVNTVEERLRYYATQFPIVEVDSTYYGLLTEHNALLWSQRTPADFVLHIKAFRLFTQHQTPPEALPRDVRERLGLPHKRNFYYRDLPEAIREELWARFRLALEPLRATGKLGVVLFQDNWGQSRKLHPTPGRLALRWDVCRRARVIAERPRRAGSSSE